MIRIHTLFRLFIMLGIAGMFGCGGGGGSSQTTNTPLPPAKATTTLSGKVEFPSLSSLVAKRVDSLADTVNVQAYSLDGVPVGPLVVADASSGIFSIPGLDSGVDYVLKATRGTQVLKKLIEKMTVAPGVSVPDQNISGVSTAAVVVASQKLAPAGDTTFNLGEPVTLSSDQRTAMSAKIFTDVSPKDLETTITAAAATVQAAITGNDLSSLTKTLADLVNTLNITLAAVSSSIDPTKVVNGQIQNFTLTTDASSKPLQLLEASTTGSGFQQATAITNVKSTEIVQTVTSSVTAYTPPSRVQLDISSTVAADAMNGITLDITVPADAIPKLSTVSDDGLSYALDLKSVSLAAGVATGTIVDAQFITATRKLRIVIAVGNNNSFLQPGKLVTILFDRTSGKVVNANNFTTSIITAIDLNGSPLLSSFTLTNTVTSSGL